MDGERTREVKEYMNTQMLRIARTSRDAHNTKIQYHRIRLRELDMMRSLVADELEESQISLDEVERQIGHIRKRLYASGGTASIEQCGKWSGLFDASSCAGFACDESESGSSYRGSGCSVNDHDNILTPSS